MYLFVQPSGTRSWIQRLVIRGRRRELGLGALALVPLAEAREKALSNRKLAREGGDPLAGKRRTQGIPTFAEAASLVLEQKQAGWRSRDHAREWLSSLRRFAFPRIGKVPVSEVSSTDVLEILTPIWHRKADTARRMKTNRQHGVPLCGRALEILKAGRTLGEGDRPLVFTHRGGKPLDAKQLRSLLREEGIAAVPHGFRSSFRDWAGEETHHPREVIEAALAHVVRNRVEAAYARSDLFKRRRVLMDDWARYLDQSSGEDLVA